ncbi:3',5'-cyclic-nucleotide phosphodiesterase [Mucor velutinosus]|uniref:3',5'-cyclic-nucleotide phosphodiesterase n=1 Tax=Mucor velutinosus TaxID=708070 RepID=A0AAN7D9Z7_9FUNG|nr:3',5'-cyclic-nucleotide phosphodiesterase [Mucor velutinosus]
MSWNTNTSPPLPPPLSSSSNSSRHNSFSGYNNAPVQRPKLTTTVWEDEGTLCYQVDAKSVCVARRQDNDMINGTKLLNVVGMSRGKRDGILKNEKGRVVVKVGAMHLKGVWITFTRAKDLATKFKIVDILYPLFVEDPSVFLSVPPPPPSSSSGTLNVSNSNSGSLPIMLPSSNPTTTAPKYTTNYGSFNMQTWEKQSYQPLPSITNQQQQDQMLIRSQNLTSGSCSPVPGSIAPILSSTATAEENDLYLMSNPYDYRSSSNDRAYSNNTSNSSYHLYGNNNNNNSGGATTTDHYSSSPYDNAPTTSPYVQQRKLHHSVIDHIADKEPYHHHGEQRRNSIDLPTSPPPEGLKYSSTSSAVWPDADTTSAAAAAAAAASDRKDASLGSSSGIRNATHLILSGSNGSCHPLANEYDHNGNEEQDQSKSLFKSRKRGHQDMSKNNIHLQRKRMKNDTLTATP